jgi:3',5'-nucleoside bisphosphate phosphatase
MCACILLAPTTPTANAQSSSKHGTERPIHFPDVPGFLTLKADLHTHSVLSDGNVWPSVRVQEAIRDGLDAISLTEHIEYRPHRDDIPFEDQNRALEIAVKAAGNSGLIVIPGTEITRKMPPGHSNAVFIKDPNALLLDDFWGQFAEAKNQGAFTFWNHPDWTSQRKDGIARLDHVHLELIESGQLSGIEVVNSRTYSDEALQIALDYNLTIIGTSDVHGLIEWDYNMTPEGHRPITLVFARERTGESIHEALVERRTAVWYKNTLIGRDDQLAPLLDASIEVTGSWYAGDTSVLSVRLKNHSDADFMLRNLSEFTLQTSTDIVTLKAGSETIVPVKTLTLLGYVALDFEVLNAVTAPNTHPTIKMAVTVGG